MSVLSSLSHIAGGCLRRDGGFLLAVDGSPTPVENVASLPARCNFLRSPDHWQLAIALGEVWDAGRAIVGNRPVFLRGRVIPATGVTEVEAVTIVATSAPRPTTTARGETGRAETTRT